MPRSIISIDFFLQQESLILRIRSTLGLVTGCFATKVVQQSSYGRIEVSYVLIFFEIVTISSLSNAISGRNTGRVHTSLVAARLVYGLTCHLADTLTGNQCRDSRCLLRDLLCDPHHITAHDNRQLVMGTLFIDIHLDIRKVDHMQVDRAVYNWPPSPPDLPPSALRAHWCRAAHGNIPHQSMTPRFATI